MRSPSDRRRFFAPLGFALPCLLFSCAASSKAIPERTAEESARAQRREIFETVWSRIHEKHFDPKFNGVDWNAVKSLYASKVELAQSESAFYGLLNQMLGELKQTHLGISPPKKGAKTQESQGRAGGSAKGRLGMVLGWVENQPTVVKLIPDSPAAKAGVQLGWSVLAVDGNSVSAASKHEENQGENVQRILGLREIQSKLTGSPGSAANVRFDDGAGALEISLVREELPVEMGSMIWFPIEIDFESRSLEGDVGYIRFSPFSMDLLPRIQTAIKSFRGAKGLVIDLRGNPGGLGLMVSPIAALLLRERVDLGVMLMREGEIRFPVFPRANPFDGPLVVLIDGGSASTSEIFAASLQELGRAAVIGETSAGAVLPSNFEVLPNGAMLQFVIADYHTAKGVYLEGRGVTPDRVVVPKRQDLLEGHDPVLDAALEEIKERNRQKEKS